MNTKKKNNNNNLRIEKILRFSIDIIEQTILTLIIHDICYYLNDFSSNAKNF